VIYVGLPYLSDFETLDLDIVGEQIRDKRKKVTHISLIVEASRGIFAGNGSPRTSTRASGRRLPRRAQRQPTPISATASRGR
jgi:hypothetical protein